jgi:hypothetical protein
VLDDDVDDGDGDGVLEVFVVAVGDGLGDVVDTGFGDVDLCGDAVEVGTVAGDG